MEYLGRRCLWVLFLSVFALLGGCATSGDVQALKKVRFIDTPEGARVIIEDSILFRSGETSFVSDADAVFDALKPSFDKARGRIVIEGHTDTQGSHEHNNRLSLARAEKVRDALVSRNVSPSRLVVKGYGKTRLARNPERTREDAQMNRRAEFLFEGETVASINGGGLLDRLAARVQRLGSGASEQQK